ncbi:MAG: DsbA family protein, partial [Solirubrobacteraceae bacterium]
ILGYAAQLGLDLEAFKEHLRRRKGAPRIAEDVEAADRSGVSGPPTFFIHGHRHQDAYDLQTLSAAVRLARTRAALSAR